MSDDSVPKLSVIGCGKVGRALARMWSQSGVFEIGDVLNRRLSSAESATRFVGAGRPVGTWAELGDADVFMLSVPDDAIASCAERLALQAVVGESTIAFHCSGSKGSSVLAPLKAAGAQIASLHPVKSFADPRLAIETFRGTHCALEGDAHAVSSLRESVERCGGHCFGIDGEHKLVYHAATVFVSNYLVGLLEVGLACLEKAGVPRTQALEIALPLASGTIENIRSLGIDEALTGPIARGDSGLVVEQLRALLDWNGEIGELYVRLGRYALEVRRRGGPPELAALERIEQAFDRALAGENLV